MRMKSHRHSFTAGLCSCGQTIPDSSCRYGIRRRRRGGTGTDARPVPRSVLRRTLLKSVGAATVLGALSTLLPVSTLKAIAQDKGPLEKTKLNVGFLPITCAAPLIYGENLGHYAKQGLQVSAAEGRRASASSATR